MVVDAAGGGATLDQMMYDEAYGKALDDGITLLGGGFGSRDNLAALDVSAIGLASGGLHAPEPAHPAPSTEHEHEHDHDLELAPAPARAHPFIHADHHRHVIAPVSALASAPNRPRRPPGATEALLGAFARADLDRWSSRELRRRFCDVLDAPPPVERMEDTSWLRARLAPHAVDATLDLDAANGPEGPGSGFANSGRDRRGGDARGDATDDDDDEDDARFRHRLRLGSGAFATASEEDARGDARTPSPFVGSAGVDGRATPANFNLAGGAYDLEGGDGNAGDIVAGFALAPAPSASAMLAVPGRVPTGEEVLATVRRRAPAATESWAMTAAAASAALSSAIRKSELAIEARARGKRAAGLASKAVSRAARAAERAEAIRNGQQKPVPRRKVPAAVIRRLSLTGSTDVIPKNQPRSNASESGSAGKRRRGSEADGDDSREASLDPETREGGGAGSGKKGKRDAGPSGAATRNFANAAASPPSPPPPPASPPRPRRPRMDLAGDPAARERAALWKRASELDACHVCGEGAPDHWREEDEIVFCDGCDVQVHLSCYGLTKVPEGEWRCVGCEDDVDAGKADEGEFGVCSLCPQPGGALARLDPPSAWDVAWESPGTHAHLACAECLPEVFVIKDAPGREGQPPLVDMSFVKAARINLRCSLCDQEGACTQCAMRKCFASFHPLCARASGFKWERHALEDGRPVMFCKTHSGDRWAEGRRVAAGKPAKPPAADAARAGSNPDVDGGGSADDAGKDTRRDKDARARSTSPDDAPGDDKDKDKDKEKDGVSDRRRRVADRAAAAARLWDGFAPFLRSTRDRTRLGKASRKMLASSGLDENERARLASLDDETGAAEFARVVASRDADVDEALARVAAAAAGAPRVAPSPWPALRPGQRETVRWLAARHLAGLGGVVADGAGAGKRLATLAHLLHLRDGLGLRGPHLLACPRVNVATWIADLNRWCPKLRAVSLASPEDERNPAKAAALRAGGIDVVIVPIDALIESSAALAAKEKAEKEEKEEKEAAANAGTSDPPTAGKEEKEEKEAAANAGTSDPPTAGTSDPPAASEAAAEPAVPPGSAPSKRRKKSSKKRKSFSDRRSRVKEDASDGVLPAAALRTSFRCLIVDADGDAAAATLPALAAASPARRVAYSRVVVVGGTLASRAGFDAAAARNLRAALALVLPEPFAAADAVEGIDTNDHDPEAHYADAASLAAPATTTNALLRFFLRVEDDDRAADRSHRAPTHETIVRVRARARARVGLRAGEGDENGDVDANQTETEMETETEARVAVLSATVPRLRATGRRMLVVASTRSTLDAASAALRDARVAHFRLDGAARGARLHAAARFRAAFADAPPSGSSSGSAYAPFSPRLRALTCATDAVAELAKDVVNAVDAVLFLDASADGRAEEDATLRLTRAGRDPNRPLATIRVALEDEDARGGAIGAFSREATLTSGGDATPVDGGGALDLGWFAGGATDAAAAAAAESEDASAWDAAEARDASRRDARDALRRRRESNPEQQHAQDAISHDEECLWCGGATGRCLALPPAFVGPDVAGKTLRCRLCPRVASFGCAAVTHAPRGGWVCPQHACHGCGRAGVDVAIAIGGAKANENENAAGGDRGSTTMLRCVTCPKAFCDECSGGADFEALDAHPKGWETRGFHLPTEAYEYVRCQLCVTSPPTPREKRAEAAPVA